MTATPLLDDLASLGDAGADLLDACEKFMIAVWHERRVLQRQQERALLDDRVADFFAANPGASANAACRAVKGAARADILDAVRRLRTSARTTSGPRDTAKLGSGPGVVTYIGWRQHPVAGSVIKVGVSIEPENRCARFGCALVWTLPERAERQLHAILAPYAVWPRREPVEAGPAPVFLCHTEWFYATDEAMALVDEYVAAGGRSATEAVA